MFAAGDAGSPRAVYMNVEEATGSQDALPSPQSRQCRWRSGLTASLLLLAAGAFAAHRSSAGSFLGALGFDAMISEAREQWPCIWYKIAGVEWSHVGNSGPGHHHVVYRVRPEKHEGEAKDLLLSMTAPKEHIKFEGGTPDIRRVSVEHGKLVEVTFAFYHVDGTKAHAQDFRINFFDLDEGTHSREWLSAFPDAFRAGMAIHVEQDWLHVWPSPHRKWHFSAKQHGGSGGHLKSTKQVDNGDLKQSVHLRYLDRHKFKVTLRAQETHHLEHHQGWRRIAFSIGETGTHCSSDPSQAMDMKRFLQGYRQAESVPQASSRQAVSDSQPSVQDKVPTAEVMPSAEVEPTADVVSTYGTEEDLKPGTEVHVIALGKLPRSSEYAA